MVWRGLFLDRDGVINLDHGYVHKRDNFTFIDGIFDLVREACNQNFKVIVITNQAGIGRGYYSEREFHLLTDWMLSEFKDADAPIDKVYFSPFHPTAGVGIYLKDDVSRKPHPGMIFQAQKDLDINLGMSILVGDSESDIRAGVAAGIKTNLLFSSVRPSSLEGIDYQNITCLSEVKPYLHLGAKLEGVQ
jgi:D-glycero-D-manno-heptose 1,7-bisphosphate phosphatase